MRKIIFALLILFSLAALSYFRFAAPGETEERAQLVFEEEYDETANGQRI